MNLSMEWLKEFVDIDVPINEFAEFMTKTGSKVESYHSKAGLIDRVVVGKVLEISNHPNADRLVVCKVDVGKDNPLQIVTAAKNLSVNDLVPVALHQSTLADGTKIKKGKLRDVLSEGMMCSIDELGLSREDCPYAPENGILVLKENCIPGQDIKEALELNDAIVEFEITSNRPDCYSMIGLSREVAATFDKKIRLPKNNCDFSSSSNLKINAEEAKCYSACIVRNVKITQSPDFIKRRLKAFSITPINNVVDVMNYVMLEYGQPLHAFDLKCIKDSKITVRKAKNGEKFITLNGEEINLSSNDIAICDDDKVLALAGIIGGKNSSIKETTTDIVIESAVFDRVSIRRSSRLHGVSTDSSFRFERGVNTSESTEALKRACYLLKEILPECELTNIISNGEISKERKKIQVDFDYVKDLLDIDIKREEMVKILEKLEFEIHDNEVLIPKFREDIANDADIAEEIIRFYGYDKIKSTPLKGIAKGGYSDYQIFRLELKRTMCALGFNEAFTYPFLDPEDFEKMLIPENSELRSAVKIRNPLGKSTSLMRTIAVPGMLRSLSRNLNNKIKSAKLFEIAKEYVPTSENELPKEREVLILGTYGDNMDFLTIKGLIEEVLEKNHVVSFEISHASGFYHPGLSAAIISDDSLLATFGEVHPLVLSKFDLDCKVFIAKIYIKSFFNKSKKRIKFNSLPKFPSVERDLSLLCDEETKVGELISVIRESGNNLIESIHLFDVYSGENIPEGKKSIAFKLILRSKNSTLKENEICEVMEKIFKNLSAKGAVQRGN